MTGMDVLIGIAIGYLGFGLWISCKASYLYLTSNPIGLQAKNHPWYTRIHVIFLIFFLACLFWPFIIMFEAKRRG